MRVTIYDYYIGGIHLEDFAPMVVTVKDGGYGIIDLEISNVNKIRKSYDTIFIFFTGKEGHSDWIDIDKNDFSKMEVHWDE